MMEIVGGVEIRRDPNCQLQSGEPVGRSNYVIARQCICVLDNSN